ncbi:MAG: NUDIX domain-containing protein [Clostridia bacterium]|nr:NUDIX domain-containing protein [Clostridia bacterium]
MISRVYEAGTLKTYKYVVVLSTCCGKLMLSRHKQRTTWETQGGHVEPGETPMEAAKRELYEESGAVRYDIRALCDYWAGDEVTGKGATGMVFHAEIHERGEIPESEMAEVRLFDGLPENLTYPAITTELYAYMKEKEACGS